MSSIDRKLKRKREKEQDKQAQKEIQRAVDAMQGLPTQCTDCGADFDLVRDADSWMVDYAEGIIRLLCEKCSLSLTEPG